MRNPDLAEVPCNGCGTAVTVYPAEDGDGPVTCGRCAGTALAVVHERVDAEMRQAVEDRMRARAEASRRRRERLAELSAAKKKRRAAGLKARHARIEQRRRT